jgi:hypothetical protein
VLGGCSSLQPRPAVSSYGCMQVVRTQLPVNDDDKRLHCLASAQIAQRCSVLEAYMAGIGKEVSDMLGRGDPEWADWQADRAGVSCGRTHVDAAELEACCTVKGY